MKLHYYKDPRGNFGDDLNPWIYYNYLPESLNKDGNKWILGIGTLINDTAPPASGEIYVMGSGVGYNKPPTVNERWKFVFVRGPLSADALGLPQSMAITDPAILTAKLSSSSVENKQLVSYMPHHGSLYNADWRALIEKSNLTYLDPAADIHQTIHLIKQSKVLITEAMHGAIVADALRVPWIPVKGYQHILDFKWTDWCKSLGLEYRPFQFPELWDLESLRSRGSIRKSNLKKLLARAGLTSSRWNQPLPDNTRHRHEDFILETLFKMSTGHAQSYLSSDTEHLRALERVENVFYMFESNNKSRIAIIQKNAAS